MAEQHTQPSGDSRSEEELQRSSDEFLRELERIDGMERRKRAMSPRDEQRIDLAHEIEDASVGLVGLSRYQTRLIEMAHEAIIGDGQTVRKPSEILEDWRTAERELRGARAAMERALDLADGLRAEHRRSLRQPGE